MDASAPEARYANAFLVGFNAFEFVLDFGQRYAEEREAQVHSRMVTSPVYAKHLLHTLRESIARYEDTYGRQAPAVPGGDASHVRPALLTQEAIMPDAKQPYGSGLNEVGLPTGLEGGVATGEALDFGGVFSKVKDWIVDNDDKVIQVVVPWIKKVVASRVGLEGLELPSSTPITAMISPSLVSRLSPAVKKLTRQDLLALGGWGVPRKLPSELGLTAKDIQTIRDVFTPRLVNPGAFEDEPEAFSLSCCSCTPCCCAAAVMTPVRTVS